METTPAHDIFQAGEVIALPASGHRESGRAGTPLQGHQVSAPSLLLTIESHRERSFDHWNHFEMGVTHWGAAEYLLVEGILD